MTDMVSTTPPSLVGITSLLATTTLLPVNMTCPCVPKPPSELEMNANKMRDIMKNKTDLLSKIHHRATHSSDAFWASFILSSMGLSLIISVLASKMWRDKEYFITHTHCQPTVYPQFSSRGEIPVKDMLISKAKTASRSSKGGDEVDSSSSIYHKLLLTQYSTFSYEDLQTDSSDEDLSPNEDEGYMYYYDTKREEWIVGVRPKKDKRNFWSSLMDRQTTYRRDKISYKKLASELRSSSDSDQGSS